MSNDDPREAVLRRLYEAAQKIADGAAAEAKDRLNRLTEYKRKKAKREARNEQKLA